MAKAVKLGRMFHRENKDRKFQCEAKVLNIVWVEDENGKNERPVAFTDTELRRATERMAKNPEDVLRRSILTDALD